MKKKILAFILTVVLMGALLSQIDVRQLGKFFQEFSVRGLFVAFGVYALSYYFRALRWNQLIHSKEIGMKELFLVTSAHIMFNNLLPSRTGELSYIYLLKKRHEIPGSEGLATLLLSRLYDFAVLATFFLVSIFFYWRSFSMELDEIILGSGVLLGVMIFAILNVARFTKKILAWLDRAAGRFGWKRYRWMNFLLEKGDAMRRSFLAINDQKRFLSLGITSACVWGFKFFSFYLMMNSILAGHLSEEFHITFWMIVLGTTAAELTTVLPVHGIGGFGTYETAWAGAFFILGFTKELAIKTALSFHLLGLLYSVILGAGALLILRLKKNTVVRENVIARSPKGDEAISMEIAARPAGARNDREKWSRDDRG